MWFLRHRPIKQKITLLILTTCGVAILLSTAILLLFQYFVWRINFEKDLRALASVLTSRSDAILRFEYAEKAREMLHSLRIQPHIVYAEFRLANGATLAQHGVRPDVAVPDTAGCQFVGAYLVSRSDVANDGDHLGSLVLISKSRAEYLRLLLLNLATLALVLTGSLGIVLFLSTRLQRIISDPIQHLAETARAVAQQRDYTARASKLENDEIGLLTDAFNQMLGRIQEQDAALRVSGEKHASLIHSIEGVVLELDPDGLEVRFVSRQAERLLGFPLAAWTQSRDFLLQRVHPDDRGAILALYHDARTSRNPFAAEFRLQAADGRDIWVRSSTSIVSAAPAQAVFRSVMLDITERKKAEEELDELHQRLIETSRQAGMAEVATAVLHNVGNVLNSVNVSATVLAEKLHQTETAVLHRINDLLRDHSPALGPFFSEHPKGRVIPQFIGALAQRMETENQEMLNELHLLVKNVEHIKNVVALQQNYARTGGVIESLTVGPLVDDALQMACGTRVRQDIEIRRLFEEVPPVSVDRHKVLQILVNVIRNAREALSEYAPNPKRLVLRVTAIGGDRVAIAVQDNGPGIRAENLTRIFALGFTTRPNGHGFGLHSGAIAARELGGSLKAFSDGPGRGATFVLELPLAS